MRLLQKWQHQTANALWVLRAAEPDWNCATIWRHGDGVRWIVDVWELRPTTHSPLQGDWVIIGTVDSLKAAKAIGRIRAAAELAKADMSKVQFF